jgi:hypothetical protein
MRGLYRGGMLNPVNGIEVDHIGALALACGARTVCDFTNSGIDWRIHLGLDLVDMFLNRSFILGETWCSLYPALCVTSFSFDSSLDLLADFSDYVHLNTEDYIKVFESASASYETQLEDLANDSS